MRGSTIRASNESLTNCEDREPYTVLDLEHRHQVPDLVLHCALADGKLPRDLAVARALDDKPEDVERTARRLVRTGCRRWQAELRGGALLEASDDFRIRVATTGAGDGGKDRLPRRSNTTRNLPADT